MLASNSAAKSLFHGLFLQSVGAILVDLATVQRSISCCRTLLAQILLVLSIMPFPHLKQWSRPGYKACAMLLLESPPPMLSRDPYAAHRSPCAVPITGHQSRFRLYD